MIPAHVRELADLAAGLVGKARGLAGDLRLGLRWAIGELVRLVNGELLLLESD